MIIEKNIQSHSELKAALSSIITGLKKMPKACYDYRKKHSITLKNAEGMTLSMNSKQSYFTTEPKHITNLTRP